MREAGNPVSTPDQAAAHEFLSELRTRISTQPLPHQHGVESRALESLWEIFGHARAAMKNHPGCVAFARRTTRMLNTDLRPVTAKWHRAYNEGQLSSRDGAYDFRADLEVVQKKLRDFSSELHEMAYGEPGEDELTPFPMDDAALEICLADLSFGIPPNELIASSTIAEINAKEKEDVDRRRKSYGLAQQGQNNAVGLGLSGGGIRSATFCLGVTQVMAERGLLKDVDFLSTVSGGGYLGCFLTTRIDNMHAHSSVAAPHGPDPGPIRHLRQRAKFLAAGNVKERWAMVTATLAGMILNWTAPLLLVALAALIAVGISAVKIPWEEILLSASGVMLVSLLVYAYRMRYAERSGGWLLGASAAVTLFLIFLWLLTQLYRWVTDLEFTLTLGATGFAAAAAMIFPVIVRFVPILRAPIVRHMVLKVMLVLAGLIIPIGAIALSFWFYNLGMRPIAPMVSTWSPLHYTNGFIVLTALTLVLGLVAIFLLNVNLTAPHRLYRNQLARTFVERSTDEAEPIALEAINPDGFAPYHLINATVNLPSSNNIALRERKSDFFLFSKYWCGAPSIGYVETSKWRADHAPINLATAMAVSGAAASSHMGLGSIPLLSALLTFLNVRLGYWLKRPEAHGMFATPGFLCLVREIFGIGMSEKADWINLSDGGHIENMAVYELLRRRCKFIISVDGEADPKSTFHGHLTLVRHAQIDFGIRIDPDLTELRPDVASNFSQSHATMCRVHYPAIDADHPAGTGLILYLKASITGNELELIKRYHALNPDFPHQTTLDQFFDEEQFEAYRQLGVHVAEGLFHRALLGNVRQPATVKEWFKSLAKNLLLPEQ